MKFPCSVLLAISALSVLSQEDILVLAHKKVKSSKASAAKKSSKASAAKKSKKGGSASTAAPTATCAGNEVICGSNSECCSGLVCGAYSILDQNPYCRTCYSSDDDMICWSDDQCCSGLTCRSQDGGSVRCREPAAR